MNKKNIRAYNTYDHVGSLRVTVVTASDVTTLDPEYWMRQGSKFTPNVGHWFFSHLYPYQRICVKIPSQYPSISPIKYPARNPGWELGWFSPKGRFLIVGIGFIRPDWTRYATGRGPSGDLVDLATLSQTSARCSSDNSTRGQWRERESLYICIYIYVDRYISFGFWLAVFQIMLDIVRYVACWHLF